MCHLVWISHAASFGSVLLSLRETLFCLSERDSICIKKRKFSTCWMDDGVCFSFYNCIAMPVGLLLAWNKFFSEIQHAALSFSSFLRSSYFPSALSHKLCISFVLSRIFAVYWPPGNNKAASRYHGSECLCHASLFHFPLI